MFEFLKSLIRKREKGDRPSVAAANTQAVGVQLVPLAAASGGANGGQAPVPSSAMAAKAPEAEGTVSNGGRSGSPVPARPRGRQERLLLNLKAITDRFAPELKPVIAQAPSPSVIVALGVDTIMEQLPAGRVEVAIADLRRMAPVGTFVPDTSRDAERVELPLQEIFAKLDPSLLPRRTQRKVEVPTEMGGIFAKKDGVPDPVAAKPEPHVPVTPVTPQPAPIKMPEPAVQSSQPASQPVPVAVPEPSPVQTTALAASPEMQALFGTKTAQPTVPEPVPLPEPPPSEPSGPVLRLARDPKPTPAEPAPAAPEPQIEPPMDSMPRMRLATAPAGSPSTDVPSVHPEGSAAPVVMGPSLTSAVEPSPLPALETAPPPAEPPKPEAPSSHFERQTASVAAPASSIPAIDPSPVPPPAPVPMAPVPPPLARPRLQRGPKAPPSPCRSRKSARRGHRKFRNRSPGSGGISWWRFRE